MVPGTSLGPSLTSLSFKSLPTFCHFLQCISAPSIINHGHTWSMKIKKLIKSFYLTLTPLSLITIFKPLTKAASLDSLYPISWSGDESTHQGLLTPLSSGSSPSLLLNSWGHDELLWNLHWKEIRSKPCPHVWRHLSHPVGCSYLWV